MLGEVGVRIMRKRWVDKWKKNEETRFVGVWTEKRVCLWGRYQSSRLRMTRKSSLVLTWS